MTGEDVPQVSNATSQDRLVRVVVIGTAVATLVVAMVGILTYARATTAADSSAVVQEGTDLQGCRSLARSPLDRARTEMEILILAGLSASAEGDGAALTRILAEADQVQVRLDSAQQTLDDANALSVSDPDAFLAQCRTVSIDAGNGG